MVSGIRFYCGASDFRADGENFSKQKLFYGNDKDQNDQGKRRGRVVRRPYFDPRLDRNQHGRSKQH